MYSQGASDKAKNSKNLANNILKFNKKVFISHRLSLKTVHLHPTVLNGC